MSTKLNYYYIYLEMSVLVLIGSTFKWGANKNK